MTNIVKTAATAMHISERYLKNCVNEYPDGYFVWEPVSGGKTAFITRDGSFLAASQNVSFKTLYDAFRKGKRGYIEYEPLTLKEFE